MKEITRISIVGTGNVAHHLGAALLMNGFHLDGVWGRTEKNAEDLAQELKTVSYDNINEISENTDLVIVCVSDNAISEVIEKIPSQFAIAYTSGSISLNSIPNRTELGVFYPLQTFTKSREVSFDKIPFLIESENEEFAASLKNCAGKLSNTVRYTTSEERFQIHIAAVMVNNFTNHLYQLADLHLKKHQLPFDILKPLIIETAEKLNDISPSEAQTGPAKRNDMNVIKKHLNELDNETKHIYEMLSKSILKHYT